MSQAAEAQKSATHSKRILVVIDRDMTAKTSKVIWQHELPVLEEIHGEGRVTEIDPDSMNEGYSDTIKKDLLPYNKTQDKIFPPSETSGIGFLFVGDPDVEYQRLAEAYGRHAVENILIVEKCYGRAKDGRLRKLLKAPKLSDLPELQLRQLLISYGEEVPKEATKDDLLATAKEIGVEL